MNDTIKQIRFLPDDEIYDIQANATRTATSETGSNVIELFDAADAPLVKCSTSITGSQNLHGYDKPWVGGSGKNKLPVTATGTTANGVTFTVNSDGTILANGTATDGNAVFWVSPTFEIQDNNSYILSGVIGGSEGTYRMMCYWRDSSSGNVGDLILTDGERQISVSDHNNAVKINTFIIVIMDGYTANNLLFRPMIRLATVTDPTFAPYSNICPITAYTEGEIEVRGKNLLNLNGFEAYGNTTINVSGDSITANTSGTFAGMTQRIELPNGNYTYSCVVDSATANTLFAIMDADNSTALATSTEASGARNIALSFTVTNGAIYTRVYVTRNQASGTLVAKNMQLEKGSTATTYEPYVGTTHTTTYPSAIYRGSEDCVNGEVTKEWAVVELSSLEWRYYSDYHLFTAFVRDSKYSGTSSLVGYGCVCSCYHSEPNKTWNNFSNGDINIGSDTIGGNMPCVNIREDSVNTVSDFVTMMTGQTLAYELATPSTSSVTPTNLPIKSLSGYNHIESSTGEMEVEYITQEYQPLVDLSDKVKQTNYYSSSQAGEVFTLPFSKDNTADTTTSSLYKNKGVEVHIGPVTNTSIMTMDSGCSYNETLNYSLMSNGGVIVGARQTLSDPMKYMSISDSDIYCTQTWDGTNTNLKQAIADLRTPGLANGILYSFSAIGNALQLGQITGTILGYIDILTHVTSSTVGDTHEAYLFSLNVDEFISSTGTTSGTEYPVESAQLIHTGQASGLVFVAYYDQSNNIYLKPVNMPGYEQTMKHISLYLSNPHVVTV